MAALGLARTHRRLLLAALLGLALLAEAADPWPALAVKVTPGPGLPPGPVTVLDGDTLQIGDGWRVRLAGVDTPEVGRPLAAEATTFSADHLRGRRVTLDPPDPGRDHYGRLLADVLADGESLSRALVAAGLAWVYRSDRQDLLAAQRDAVDQRRGLHGWPSSGPWLVTAGSFHAGGCRMIRRRLRELPLEIAAGALFESGRSPCRLCLAWPPVRISP